MPQKFIPAEQVSIAKEVDSLALLKWDLNGNLLWNTTWPGSYGESYGKGIWGDNQFVYTTGSTWANGSLNTLLIKWDSSGDIIWSHTWSDGYGDEEIRFGAMVIIFMSVVILG